MDSVTQYALELIDEQARSYRQALAKPGISGRRTVELDADTLAFPLEAMASKIRTRQDEQDRIVAQ